MSDEKKKEAPPAKAKANPAEQPLARLPKNITDAPPRNSVLEAIVRSILEAYKPLNYSSAFQALGNTNLLGSYTQHDELETEISKLKLEIRAQAKALTEQTSDAKQKEKQIQGLEKNLRTLEEKQNLSHLLNRVGRNAQEKLLSSPDFKALFDRTTPCLAYVLSIDIRRSTELMLKAREPRLYAKFIIELASQLRNVILDSYGIFDKFTGDGILAFFPDFYSGVDAGYFAMKAASDCHQVFKTHYGDNRSCFISVLRDIGLGIGLDYGPVHVVQIGGDLTVVGTPVVYACRMAGADARHTFVNQPAFEELFERYSAFCDFEQKEIDIKHEGKTLAYDIVLNGKIYTPSIPDWNSSNGAAPNTSSGEDT